jgi:catechol 2,3-dioxygenase-like lactoylglutathione lyase family enzyme
VLSNQPFVGFVLISDAARAKAFYCDVLGLSVNYEDGFAVVLDVAGASLRLALAPDVPEPAGTNIGWQVDDINAEARQLAAAGVVFERFDGMDQDDDGVWHPPGGGGVAWFRDPDGNRLSLAQSV